MTDSENISSGTYTSTNKDENVISASNVTSTISDISVIKSGDSKGGDNTSFYGTNSAIIAKDGANLTLKNINVATNATGANGVFCYGGSATTNNSSNDGTTLTISDSVINTTKDNSGGIMTNGNFLRIQKDSWGNKESNGGIVNFIMSNQKASGSIVVDSISTLDLYVKNSSYFEGSINNENTAKSVKLILDNSSSIKLTTDSYVTSFENVDKTNNNINFNGYKLYVNGKAINE